MKSAVLYQPNTPLELEPFELPETWPTQVRVRWRAADAIPTGT